MTGRFRSISRYVVTSQELVSYRRSRAGTGRARAGDCKEARQQRDEARGYMQNCKYEGICAILLCISPRYLPIGRQENSTSICQQSSARTALKRTRVSSHIDLKVAN